MSRSWVEVDLGAIAHNVAVLAGAADGADVCAVVKADGYGHGAISVAQAAIAAGATTLAVAQVDEGVELREAGIEAPIWVLSEPEPHEFVATAELGLQPAIYSEHGIEAAAAVGVTAPLTVHLKVDTGMHRVGAAPADVVARARSIVSADGLTLGSVFTHCAVADEPTNPFTDQQLARFDSALGELAEAGIEVPFTHAANSAGTLVVPSARRDIVRVGIAMYGLAPSPDLAEVACEADLRPALSWHSRVSFVKRLAAGNRVSYGQRAAVDRETTVATIPLGYADGFRRGLWRDGSVLIGGKPRPILGVVTMDQFVVDCGDDDVAAGDDVVLIGHQGGSLISADDLAAKLDTINYEIVCGISKRVERRYR